MISLSNLLSFIYWHQVNMKMRYFFSLHIQHHIFTSKFLFHMFHKFFCCNKKMRNFGVRCVCHSCIFWFCNQECMSLTIWFNIQKGERLIIFIDNISWNLSVYDFGKDCTHDLLLLDKIALFYLLYKIFILLQGVNSYYLIENSVF